MAEGFRLGPDREHVCLLGQLQGIGDPIPQFLTYGGCRRKTGAFDTDGFKCPIGSAFHGAYHKVAAQLMRADTGEIGDHTAYVDARPRFCGLLQDIRQTLGRGACILGIVNILCGRPDQQVAMGGRRYQNTLAHRGGYLKNCHREAQRILPVHQVILSPARNHGELARRDHVMKVSAVYAGAVDKGARLKAALVGFDQPAAADRLHIQHLSLHDEVDAIIAGSIGQRVCHLIRACQTGTWHMQGHQHILIDIGLQGQDLVLVNDPALCHPVLQGLLIELFDFRPVCLVKTQHEGAGLAVGHAQLPAQRRIHPRAFYVEARLVTARLRIISRVDNAAVGFTCAFGYILRPLQQGYIAHVPGKLPGYRAAYHATADHNNIVHFQNPLSLQCG